MNNKVIFYIGILGVSLFVISSILGGFLIDNYSITSQYISETYAIDTTYGKHLRALGYIPSGILITFFYFLAYKHFYPSKLIKFGFWGLGIFYGIATIIVSFFPCDSGCNKEFINPSTSQIIHNLTGLLTYLSVPVCFIIIGLGLKKTLSYNKLVIKSILYGIVSFIFICILFSNQKSEYIGLYQRIIETMFVLGLITFAIEIKNKK